MKKLIDLINNAVKHVCEKCNYDKMYTRRCIMKQNITEKTFSEQMAPMSMKVTEISLMKSEHIEGKLIYSSLGEVKLQE